MEKLEQQKFNEFIQELKKYEFIDQYNAIVLLDKFTRGFPFNKSFFNQKAKLNYFGKYWFKIACKKGILENRGLGYKVLKHD